MSRQDIVVMMLCRFLTVESIILTIWKTIFCNISFFVSRNLMFIIPHFTFFHTQIHGSIKYTKIITTRIPQRAKTGTITIILMLFSGQLKLCMSPKTRRIELTEHLTPWQSNVVVQSLWMSVYELPTGIFAHHTRQNYFSSFKFDCSPWWRAHILNWTEISALTKPFQYSDTFPL